MFYMAISMIKSTYSLDPQTVQELDQLARYFGTSKSEVLRRAILALARQQADAATDGQQALDDLQNSMALSESAADDWLEKVRRERASSGRSRIDG